MSLQKMILVLLFSLIFINYMNAQYKDFQIDYFGQTPPGNNSVVFAPDFISRDGWRVLNSCFSPDGKEFTFNIFNAEYSYAYTMYTKYIDGKWTEPDTLFDNYRVKNFSHNGDSLYLISPKGMNGPTPDIWVSTRENGVWKVPVDMGYPINTNDGYEFEICQTANGTIYFSSNRPGGYGEMDVYRAELVDGKYEKAVNLGAPINTSALDECPYVAPDESFMVFNSWKPNPRFKTNNIYITYRKEDGSWTNPKDLGASVNTDERDVYPYITPDGKYLLYTIYTYGPPNGPKAEGKIYWIKADFIDSLKHTNFEPYCRNPISNMTAAAGTPFTYEIPDSTFMDDDENDSLSFSVSGMPSWMSFDPETKTFSGTPVNEANAVWITVTASDTAHCSTTLRFSIKVQKATDVEKGHSSIDEFKLDQNYPNPFNPVTNIGFRIAEFGYVTLKVYNLLGREVATLINEELKPGTYKVKFSAGPFGDGSSLCSGMYFYTLKSGEFSQTRKLVLLR